MKIMQFKEYQEILYAIGLVCPLCEKEMEGLPFLDQNLKIVYKYDLIPKPIIVGWCEDIAKGFMAVFQCQKCFRNYRHHIDTGVNLYIFGKFKEKLNTQIWISEGGVKEDFKKDYVGHNKGGEEDDA